jgi:hypothetical protein
MDTPVIVALITAGAGLLIGIVGLFNQTRLEGLKKSIDFDTTRFERLREIKNTVVALSDGNKHSNALLLKHKEGQLDNEGLFQARSSLSRRTTEGCS